MVWVLHLELPHLFPGHLLCHRAAGMGAGEKDLLFRRQNFNGFRHKPHTAHQNIFLRNFCCLDTQRIGVACKVGDLCNLCRLVAVRQNAKVLFLFQLKDFVLYFSNLHLLFHLLRT